MNDLFNLPNVIGHGQIEGRRCALVTRKVPLAALSKQEMIPDEFAVIEIGYVRALQDPKDRHRPAPGGVSIGHYKITAGTLGCVVRDADTDERLILSNWHVLAGSEDAEFGDPIYQPGAADGGTNEDNIAYLLRFQPIDFGQSAPTCPIAGNVARLANLSARVVGSQHRLEVARVNPQAVNLIDAAVARPINDEDVSDEILNIGKVVGATGVLLGEEVQKSGRTTGHTKGNVIVVDATISVSYGPSGSATFEDQIIAGPMSAGGDSGSLGIVIIDGIVYAFGLLFAGSEGPNGVTIYNPIHHVLNMLNVKF
jgi:hypothetical protein